MKYEIDACVQRSDYRGSPRDLKKKLLAVDSHAAVDLFYQLMASAGERVLWIRRIRMVRK